MVWHGEGGQEGNGQELERLVLVDILQIRHQLVKHRIHERFKFFKCVEVRARLQPFLSLIEIYLGTRDLDNAMSSLTP